MSVPIFNLIVAICMMVIATFIVAWVVGTLIAVFQIKNVLQKTSVRTRPVIARANETLGTVNTMVHDVQEKMEAITTSAQDTVDTVSRKIKGTTEVITETAASPLITVSSFITGLARGLEIYSDLQRRRGGMKRAA